MAKNKCLSIYIQQNSKLYLSQGWTNIHAVSICCRMSKVRKEGPFNTFSFSLQTIKNEDDYSCHSYAYFTKRNYHLEIQALFLSKVQLI